METCACHESLLLCAHLAHTTFATHCGRHYDLVKPFQLDDADYVLVMSNAFATKGKAAVQVRHPRLLYTQPEQERMQTLLHIAGKEVAG